jgi:hypothetical protein
MAKGRDNVQAMWRGKSGETEEGHRPTGVSPGEMEPLGHGQRWTAARKREVVLRIFRGEPLDLVSRELGVELYRLAIGKDHQTGAPGPGSPGWRTISWASGEK